MTFSPLLPPAGSPAGASSTASVQCCSPPSLRTSQKGNGGYFRGLPLHVGWWQVELWSQAPLHPCKDKESPKPAIPLRTLMDQGPSLDGMQFFWNGASSAGENPHLYKA